MFADYGMYTWPIDHSIRRIPSQNGSAPSSMIRLRGRPSSTSPCSRVVPEMTYPYDCMGHNSSISSANDVDIPPIDGAMDIVLTYYDGVESGNAKSRVVCGYFLAILSPIRTFSFLPMVASRTLSDEDFLLEVFWVCFCVMCFCVAEISGAVINNNCTILFPNSLSLVALIWCYLAHSVTVSSLIR